MVILKDFPRNSALFGLVMVGDIMTPVLITRFSPGFQLDSPLKGEFFEQRSELFKTLSSAPEPISQGCVTT